ncbi:hypothetical protein Tco_1224165 [Tanacetum coccineum]
MAALGYCLFLNDSSMRASPTRLLGLIPYSDSDSDSPDEIESLSEPGRLFLFETYRTHLNGPHKLLTARKRVGPLPARRLAWRHASPRSSDHHPSSSSSSSDSSPVHSLGLDAPDQAHSRSSTRDVPPRLCYPSRRGPPHSEAFPH